MSKEKQENIDYIGLLILIAFSTYFYLTYDSWSSIENIRSLKYKGKFLVGIFYGLNQVPTGYFLGRGIFLAVSIYLLRKLYFKYRSKN
ncbi:hypothetical protein KO500_14330 [Cellulophaga baltica]|uniref:hypothetical protein n=1 Tax=Cellulophaga TaxID=104264 RepID=UPI001C07CDD6|nr:MULTISPECIES: hypothetical protein [Cellulophaga]MBU2997623.1 hypothetical protein [Cellulophaga baltica]MDO6769018.1 hypothetical protein [Cellulophaga sp. 1_MG-2023]